MISTLILPPSRPMTLKPSETELLLWLLRNEPQIRLNVEDLEEDDDVIDVEVKVLALRCKEFFLFFLEAIFPRISGSIMC